MVSAAYCRRILPGGTCQHGPRPCEVALGHVAWKNVGFPNSWMVFK